MPTAVRGSTPMSMSTGTTSTGPPAPEAAQTTAVTRPTTKSLPAPGMGATSAEPFSPARMRRRTEAPEPSTTR